MVLEEVNGTKCEEFGCEWGVGLAKREHRGTADNGSYREGPRLCLSSSARITYFLI